MKDKVSDFLIKRLSEWGIKRIYGFPGDGINGILGALNRAGDMLDFVQVRHEEMAAFMACAHAKFTGEIGVCMATSGPGAVHLLNGLYDAQTDHQPVVAIVGQQARAAMGGNYQQEIDLISLYKDVAREYVHMASDPIQIRHLVDRAIRIAKVERTVTCIIIPNDVQELDAVETPPRAHGTIHSGTDFSMPHVVPKEPDLHRAAEVLANWFARDLKIRRGMMASLSGNLATMCPGVPYAIAAKFAFPDRVAIALVGDGAMQMLGNNELITISKYWKEWSDPRLIVLVLNNRDLNQVTWEMRAMSGDPKYETSQDLPDFPFARYAELLGLHGIRVDKPEDIGPAWDDALSANRPVVFEAYTDPNVPTLPPHISFHEAATYSSALLKGDPEEGGIIKQTIKDAVATILLHQHKK